jgi:hypothetical protein
VGKYDRVSDWLGGKPRAPFEISFGGLEDAIGVRLPAAYHRHLAPWYGRTPGTLAAALARAGWRARRIDLTGEILTLEPRTELARGDPESGRSRSSRPAGLVGTPPPLPFVRLPGGGRTMLGKPSVGDLTARKGYGLPVFAGLGHSCAYCGLDLRKYEAWLAISVDHVLPQYLAKQGWRADWLSDLANLLPCCRACNEFTNGYRVSDAPPTTTDAFFDLRDGHFEMKRTMALAAHARERAWHGVNVALESTVKELMTGYRDSLAALKEKGVIRSSKVLADYAEWLSARGLGLQLAPAGAMKGYDAVDPSTGVTYQVKARHVVPPYMQPDLRGGGSLEPKPFDFLIGVLLDAEYGVIRAAVIPHSIVAARAKRIAYNNGYRFHMGSTVLSLPEVRDVTEELRVAAAS